jgi:hypothetical protein
LLRKIKFKCYRKKYIHRFSTKIFAIKSKKLIQLNL